MSSKNALFEEYARKSVNSVIKDLNTFRQGLNDEDAAERIRQYGKNELSSSLKNWYHILIRQFRSSFTYLLIGAAVLALLMKEYIDMAMIAVFLAVNVTLGFLEEHKSEKAVALLKKYINVRARVRRNGREVIIGAEEVVPGDIVIVEAGDIVPADLRLISENNLALDEEPLTGESVSIAKSADPIKAKNIEIYQASNICFSGTRVTGGRGEGAVIATGKNTVIGQIAKLTEETRRVSAFEKGIDKFSKFILYLVIITLCLVFIANIVIKRGELNVFELTLFAIALAVSVIPEALPVVTSVSLSQGAIRLAKQNVVVRRLSAVEDLGSIEILCTDKTGTLTENKLTVVEVNAKNKILCLEDACLATSFLNEQKEEPNNAFDIALWNELDEKARQKYRKVARSSELPFTPDRRRNSVIVSQANKLKMIVRGAPEAVWPLCLNVSKKTLEEYVQWAANEGRNGRRVLAVAEKAVAKAPAEYGEKEEAELTYIGMVSFEDPIKESTQQAVNDAKFLGVQVKILTGDSLEVATAVGQKIGLIESESGAITGEELESMDVHRQKEVVREKNVFARVSPQQKYHIIKLLQEKSEVGFLGEGINDAPALKIANVSLVVESASDIARESSDIILLQQSLEVIISGIKQGREIFSNTVKYIKSTLTSNFGNFYAIAAATLIIDYLPMLPLQILLLNLLSDFPMIAVAMDNVDVEELKRPRSYEVKEIVLIATLLGVISTFFDFIFFALFMRHDPSVLHTNWFIASILTELVLIFSIRTRLPFFKVISPAKSLSWLTVNVALITVILPFTYLGQRIFSFTSPKPAHLALILFLVGVYFFITERVKLKYYQFTENKNSVKV